MRVLKLNWAFWALWAYCFYVAGWRAVYKFPFYILLVIVVVYAIFLPWYLSIMDFRIEILEKEKVFGGLIKFLCRIGWHTPYSAKISVLKVPECGDSWVSMSVRAGESRVVSANCSICGKKMILHSFVKLDDENNGKPFWGELGKKDLLEFQKDQSNAVI